MREGEGPGMEEGRRECCNGYGDFVYFDHTGSPPVDCDGRSEGQTAT